MPLESKTARLTDEGEKSGVLGSGVNFFVGGVVEPTDPEDMTEAGSMAGVQATLDSRGKAPRLAAIKKHGENAGVEDAEVLRMLRC